MKKGEIITIKKVDSFKITTLNKEKKYTLYCPKDKKEQVLELLKDDGVNVIEVTPTVFEMQECKGHWIDILHDNGLFTQKHLDKKPYLYADERAWNEDYQRATGNTLPQGGLFR